MKKTALTILLVLLSYISYSQSIKVKKGNILFDDKIVGYVESKQIENQSNYTYYDTTRKIILTAVEKWYKPDPNKEPIRWLVFHNADKTKTTELPIEFFRVYFTNDNNLTKSLAKDLHLITSDGYLLDSVRAFFEVSRPKLTEKYLGQKDADEKMASQSQKLLDEMQPILAQDNRTIMAYGNKPIGIMNELANDNFVKIALLDLDNQTVAVVNYYTTGDAEIHTYKNEKLYFRSNSSQYRANRYLPVKDAVVQLITHGYLFQHQIVEEQIATKQAMIAQEEADKIAKKELRKKINSILQPIREERTGNLYGTPSTVYFGNDDFFKPDMTVIGNIDFEYTDYIPQFKDSVSFELLSLDTIQSPVAYAAILSIDPEKNTVGGMMTPKKQWLLEAKSRDKFCATKNGTKRCFEGIHTQVGKPNFYEIITENSLIKIAIDPYHKKSIAFKLHDEKKGVLVSESVHLKDLTKYLKKYPSAVEEINKYSSSADLLSNIHLILQYIK